MECVFIYASACIVFVRKACYVNAYDNDSGSRYGSGQVNPKWSVKDKAVQGLEYAFKRIFRSM